MTGNLEMLMMFRDMQVAQDVGRMAELGRYDREFTCYGFMYWAGQQRHYVISSSDDRLYDQALALSRAGYWLTPIASCSQICHVPAGCEEELSREVKIALARTLQTNYPLAFAEAVNHLAALPPTDAAAPILETLREQLEGHYDRDALDLFATLVESAWQGKTLTAATNQVFQHWLAQNQKDMADDIFTKDIFERTFYGFAYESSGQYRYKINANRGALFRLKQQLMLNRVWTTPIIAKTFWYNYSYRLADARAAFENYLRQQMENGYLDYVRKLTGLPSAISQAACQKTSAIVQKRFSAEAQQTLSLLSGQWHVSL